MRCVGLVFAAVCVCCLFWLIALWFVVVFAVVVWFWLGVVYFVCLVLVLFYGCD